MHFLLLQSNSDAGGFTTERMSLILRVLVLVELLLGPAVVLSKPSLDLALPGVQSFYLAPGKQHFSSFNASFLPFCTEISEILSPV